MSRLTESKNSIQITIITVVKDDFSGLVKTVVSVDKQSRTPHEHIIIASGFSDEQKVILEKKYAKKFRIFMWDSDTSLYDAMNLGIDVASGTHVHFLNAGDFYCKPDAIERIRQSTEEKVVTSFRVVQAFAGIGYVRPGNIFDEKKIQHSGIVVPRTPEVPSYNEKVLIGADRLWIQAVKRLYGFTFLDDCFVQVELGGVSNRPTWNTVNKRWETEGGSAGLKEMMKFVLHVALGHRRAYRMRAKMQGFYEVQLGSGGR